MPNLTRREWMGSLAATATALAAPPPRRPNVILVMTDDQAYGDLSCHGNPYLHTPNIDAFARQGVEFSRFYVSPVCAPTRSSLLTGRYNLRCGVYGVTSGFETMRTEEVTIGEAFRAGGYRTGLIGKWHLGENYPNVPHAQGFDEFVGFRPGHWLNYFDPELERNGRTFRAKGFISDVFTDEAISFLERNRQHPFLLYLPYNAPHSPFQAPDKYFERFRNHKDLNDETAAVYAMCENLDDNFGRLTQRVDELGLAQDTIFIFMSDNGPAGGRFNSGLRGGKGAVYEGGVRVPFFIRWPGHFQAGRKVDTIAAHIDVYPTLADLCGVARPDGPPIDGMSIRPVLEGQPHDWPDRRIFTHRAPARNPSGMYPGTVRSQRFNLVNGKELYEIPEDPGEKNDVAAKYPEKVKELRAAYETWFPPAARECGFAPKPIPVGYSEENPAVLMAPQSERSGGVKFFNEKGYAHDWIDGWTSTDATVSWEIDVHQAGTYELSLAYACPASDVGARITATAGGAEWTAEVRQATSMDPLPNHNLADNRSYIDLAWGTLSLGRARLDKGRTRLTVKASSKPGKEVMQLQSAALRRIG